MAKACMVQKEINRRRLAARYKAKREKLKAIAEAEGAAFQRDACTR